MVALSAREKGQVEQMLRELVDVALSAIHDGTLSAPSAEVELDLWMALRRVLAREQRRLRLIRPVKTILWLDDRIVAELTEAAYQSALARTVLGSFLEVELAIWNGFQVVAKNRGISARELPS